MHLSIRICLTPLTIAFIYINPVESLGPNAEYVIWPKGDINQRTSDSVIALIADYAGGPSKVYTSSGEPYSLVLYWSARLPNSAIRPIERHDAVRRETQNLPQS